MTQENHDKYDLAVAALLNRPDVKVLAADEERALLCELDECKQLIYNLAATNLATSTEGSPEHEIQDFVRELLDQMESRDAVQQQISRVAVRYSEIRGKLAMANLRLVAHVARRYRNRGIAAADLLQDGFCGLLKAIDRFEPGKQTRLASYAVWWIRQALQRSVAAGAYPVRLNPRHLQQLAQRGLESAATTKTGRKRSSSSATTLDQIHSATRPTVSLNANLRADEGSCLLNSLTYPSQGEDPRTELDEYLVVMMRQLKPREQVVLQLRFGLAGNECHSLSQVSEVLDVSKERIRQIQEGALQKLRNLARDNAYCEAMG